MYGNDTRLVCPSTSRTSSNKEGCTTTKNAPSFLSNYCLLQKKPKKYERIEAVLSKQPGSSSYTNRQLITTINWGKIQAREHYNSV